MDDCRTPQKVGYAVASVQQFYKKTSPAKFKLINNHIKAQLNPSKTYGKLPISNLATQTPDKNGNEFIMLTPGRKCSLSSTAKSFHLFPLTNTPPSENKTKKKIVNPFEAALADRLHLPLICSPSLFHRPSTPHYSSSTNFEWTIEEVSSIGPANVEPHETQFQDSLDPEIEAKTQAAISSFFKEQQIVPSPVECPLRKQRIMLTKTEPTVGVSPGIRRAKRIRDGITQTILTLPPVLPPGIEEALKPYFNFIETQQQSPTIICDKSDSLKAYHEARDASLRRKLFAVPNMPHDDTLDGEYDESEILENSAFSSPPPKSPDLVEEDMNTSKKEPSENKPFDKNSFGSLSPISKLSKSPNPKRFSGERCFLNNLESEIISPIKSASSPNITIQQSKINSTSLHQRKDYVENIFGNSFNDSRLYRSTPDHSMQLVNSFCENQSGNNNMSVESTFNCKISRLLVDSSSIPNEIKTANISKSKSMTDVDVFNPSEYDEDDMQVSQLSEKSTNSLNSSNSDTPRRSKKTANRKNLSRSFSSHLSDDEDEINIANISKDIIQIIDNVQKSRNSIQNTEDLSSENTNLKPYERSVFYRVDSGFNEMTNTQDDTKFVQILKNSNTPKKEKQYSKIDENVFNITLANEDISMISCSTPSRKVF